MRNIIQDIKSNAFKNIYLLCGDEAYLRKQYRDKLKTAICGDDTMNYAYFEGKGIQTEEVILIADTMPFFADRRLVVVENSGFFKSANEKMVEFIDRIPETVVLLFVEEEVDKRGKLYKLIKEKGYISEMSAQTPATLQKWIVGILNGNNKKITKETLDYFIAGAGTDMTNISSELEKLISYTKGRDVITISDVNEICTVQTVGKIFDMIDAMGNKNRVRTLDLYYDMIEVKEPPMRIMYMLARQFNIMLQVGELHRNGMSGKEISVKLGLAPFVVTKAMKQVGNFKAGDLKAALRECLQIEEDVKNGRVDEKIGVEMILIKYSGKNRIA